MRSQSHRSLTVVLFALVALILSACGTATPATPTAEPQVIRETVEVQVTVAPEVIRETVEVEVPVEVAGNPGSLVIYSGRSEALVGPIIQQDGVKRGMGRSLF